VENRGLLFIPDISGFTRFVNQTEIEHSRLIIQELLEILINANQMGLEVSEIEGDAILFYRFGDSPNLEDVYKQVEKMFCEFHKHLMAYEHRRYCYCTACNAAVDLTLKVITHYGEFTRYTVRQFSKLIGRDVIVAHQLLKNDIDQHEYWLVTPSLAGQADPPTSLADWMQWKSSTKRTDGGEIPFHYTQLGQLRNTVTPDPAPQLELSSRTKVLSFTKEYDTDIITLFHATGDFNHRSRWQEGVRSVEEVAHFLPRVGMKCRCVMDNGEVVVYASSYTFSWERIAFSETDEHKSGATYYTLEKTGEGTSRLSLDYFVKNNIISRALFILTRKKTLQARFTRSLDNLERLVKELAPPA
jgi:hypothetical protein